MSSGSGVLDSSFGKTGFPKASLIKKLELEGERVKLQMSASRSTAPPVPPQALPPHPIIPKAGASPAPEGLLGYRLEAAVLQRRGAGGRGGSLEQQPSVL